MAAEQFIAHLRSITAHQIVGNPHALVDYDPNTGQPTFYSNDGLSRVIFDESGVVTLETCTPDMN